MIIIGGVGTIVGPLIGTIVYVVLETLAAAYTQHWMIMLGPVILVVALAHRGLYGSFLDWLERKGY